MLIPISVPKTFVMGVKNAALLIHSGSPVAFAMSIAFAFSNSIDREAKISARIDINIRRTSA